MKLFLFLAVWDAKERIPAKSYLNFWPMETDNKLVLFQAISLWSFVKQQNKKEYRVSYICSNNDKNEFS